MCLSFGILLTSASTMALILYKHHGNGEAFKGTNYKYISQGYVRKRKKSKISTDTKKVEEV